MLPDAYAVALLYVMYEWGRFEGGFSKIAEVQRRRELNARIASLEDDNEKLRADVAAAELARNVDRKAYADVEKNLAELGRLWSSGLIAKRFARPWRDYRYGSSATTTMRRAWRHPSVPVWRPSRRR